MRRTEGYGHMTRLLLALSLIFTLSAGAPAMATEEPPFTVSLLLHEEAAASTGESASSPWMQ